MKEAVAIAKEADAKKGVSPTRSDNSIPRLRDEHERQLGSLRGVIGNITRNGGKPSVESIATQLSRMPNGERAPALLALQQTHGNRYVQRVVSGIQAKLKVGQPGDKYEQEADRVAEQVMRMKVSRSLRNGDDQIQRSAMDHCNIEKEVDQELLRRIESLRGSGQPLGSGIRTEMEAAFGYDFGDVRLHTDSEAQKTVDALDARAFTSGQDIWLGRGESSGNISLLAHELTHVVQQTEGRTAALRGIVGDEAMRESLEREAESVQQQVKQGVKALTPGQIAITQHALQRFASYRAKMQLNAVQRQADVGDRGPLEGNEEAALREQLEVKEPEIEVLEENIQVAHPSSTREEEAIAASQLARSSAIQTTPGDNGGPSLGDIVNTVSTAWDIIKDNRPVASTATDRANAVPRDVDFTQLTGWAATPSSYRFRIFSEYLLLPGNAVEATFRIMYNYGGRYQRRGLFLNNVTLECESADVAWGQTFNANATIRNPLNRGTVENPIAALPMTFRYQASNVFQNFVRSSRWEARGDGSLYRF